MQYQLSQMLLPIESLYILYTLQKAGFQSFIVGGAVRDLVLHEMNPDQAQSTPDFDFTTNATPEEALGLFANSFCENEYGTVSITKKHLHQLMGIAEDPVPAQDIQTEQQKLIDVSLATKIHDSLLPKSARTVASSSEAVSKDLYEITPFRSGEKYEHDYRRPTSFQWGSSLSEDLTRRDFSINALAIAIDPSFLADLFMPKTGATLTSVSVEVPSSAFTIIDQHNGLQDLVNQVIDTVGDPDRRLSEDALRMLRAVRFAVQLNMKISDRTYAAMKQHAGLIQHISWERIRDEFLKILSSQYPKEGVELLAEVGLLRYILPELLTARGVEQGGHHTTDVWTHSLDALQECSSADPIVRLATLLHDIGKPETVARQNGSITFYNHEVIGAHMAKAIAKRFNLSKRDIDRVFILVRHHMFHYQPEHTDAAIRRFMRKVGLENVDDMLSLREADRLGSGARRTSWRLEEMKQRMLEQLHQPFSVTDLAIDGNDLMSELQLPPGRIIGQLLHELFEMVMEEPELNTREKLLEKARDLLPTLATKS